MKIMSPFPLQIPLYILFFELFIFADDSVLIRAFSQIINVDIFSGEKKLSKEYLQICCLYLVTEQYMIIQRNSPFRILLNHPTNIVKSYPLLTYSPCLIYQYNKDDLQFFSTKLLNSMEIHENKEKMQINSFSLLTFDLKKLC